MVSTGTVLHPMSNAIAKKINMILHIFLPVVMVSIEML